MNFEYEVSIVIPVYNVEKYLEKCINSLLEQTIDKSKIEVVLVDDGSTDSSPEICDKFAKEYDFIHVHHVANGGVSSARNYGIDNAHGKYILFLDSDDWLTKKSIKNIVSFFNKHYDEIDIVTYEELRCKNDEIKKINQITIVACGSAYHVGVVAQYVFEDLAKVPVRVELASEFRYRKPLLDPNTLVIVISQSGETADSLAALREAKYYFSDKL